MLTAIAFAAYVRITLLSLNEGNSLSIYMHIFTNIIRNGNELVTLATPLTSATYQRSRLQLFPHK